MQIFKCPIPGCDHTCGFGISTGGLPICPIHNVQVAPVDGIMQEKESIANIASNVGITANFNVGGNLYNFVGGKIKISNDGHIQIYGDVLNEGDIKVGSDEWKQILLECIKSTGSLAELGAAIINKFFNNQK